MIAESGYFGFAADIYGADLQENLTIPERIPLATSYRSNPELFVSRMESAISQVKMVDGVDPDNIAVIGYCFGGTGIVELAFSGNADAKLVVAYHGGLQTLPNPDTNVTPYTLM